jgi:hypothetical protein
MTLTEGPGQASPIADPEPGSTPGRLLSLHRRFELLVAALAIGAVAILAGDAEPAPAQTTDGAAGNPCLIAHDSSSSGSEGLFLQRKIRCRTVSSRLQEGAGR